MNPRTILTALLVVMLLSACSLPQPTQQVFFTPTSVFIPNPTISPPTANSSAVAFPSATLGFPTQAPTGQVFVTAVASPAAPIFTPVVAPTQAPLAMQPAAATFCADTQPQALVNDLKKALQTSDGVLLASLVSPVHGMDARYYRTGRVVNYDRLHAKFLFESDFQVNWGDAPGSGLPTIGSFHETIIPAMRKVFDVNYTAACNQLQVGGTTYIAEWPYPGVNYYSLYFPGTAANGNMDWRTLLIGMEYVNGKPYIHSITQFEWEI